MLYVHRDGIDHRPLLGAEGGTGASTWYLYLNAPVVPH